MPHIQSIYIAPTMGEPMTPLPQVQAIAGKGLEGDRYAEGRGAYSRSKVPKIRHVSLIAAEAIAHANQTLKAPFTESETRRNLVTADIELNELIGIEFCIGDVVLRGTELCDPCARPSRLSGKPDFLPAFQGLGGLRAEIMQSGLIAVGQTIEIA